MNRQVMDKVARGMARLAEQFAGSVKLEDEIKEYLVGLRHAV